MTRRERREPDDIADSPCVCCERNPDRACPACAARRRRAVRLVVGQRLTLPEAAQAMALPVARVERLLEEDADHRTIKDLIQTHVTSAALRDQFAISQSRDPTLTIAELARRVGSSQAQVERWLGLRPTASKTDRRGRTYPGRTLDRVPVETAGRLARAMGCAPHEIDGC